MKKITYNKQRLGILRIMDTTGIIDTYIFFLLEALKEYIDDFVIFCSDETEEEVINKLKNYSSRVYKFDNKTFRDNSFKKYCEIEFLSQYKQVLFFDDSIFGPFYPLENMFEKMNHCDADFWGITYKEDMIDDNGFLEISTLHPYFVLMNNNILNSELFKHFLIEEKDGSDYIERLINKLTENGFLWRAYVDTSNYKAELPEKNLDCSIYSSFDLISNKQCPFVRKACFLIANSAVASGENSKNTIDYIQNHTKYNIKMIWDNLLRTNNVSDIKNALHLEYVLPWKSLNETSNITEKSVAVIIHLHYEDLVEECFIYIRQIPKCIDIYITVSNENTKKEIEKNIRINKLENCKIIDKLNRGRDVSALLVSCRTIALKYDFVCFVHDKKASKKLHYTEAKSFMYNLWENMLKSSQYIGNIIQCFEDNPRLGVLGPPEPYHGGYFGAIGNGIDINFNNLKELALRLNLDCILDNDKPPYIYGTAFWCRTKALQSLLSYDFIYEDFPAEPMAGDGTFSHAVERIFAYVAQSERYYTGIVMNTDYAALRVSDLTYMYHITLKSLKEEYFIINFNDIISHNVMNNKIINFFNSYNHIFIYGAGNYGQRFANILINKNLDFQGFIVSDNQNNDSKVKYHTVYKMSEIKFSPEECGIILAVKKAYQKEVVPYLLAKGFHNILYIV